MAKPTTLPRWADQAGANTNAPTTGLQNTGWTINSTPSSGVMNWLLLQIYNWLMYLDGLTGEALTWTAAHIFQKGLTVTQSIVDTEAIVATGSGTKAGIKATGGTTNGNGVEAYGKGTGIGVYGESGPSISGTGGPAVKGVGHGYAPGGVFMNDDLYSNATGLVVTGGNPGGTGIKSTGNGGGAGIQAIGGSTGAGVVATGSKGVVATAAGGEGVLATSSGSYGVKGIITGTTNTAAAVAGDATGTQGWAVFANGGTVRGPLMINPQAYPPSGPSLVGEMYVDLNGVLWIYTASTGWARVGSQ